MSHQVACKRLKQSLVEFESRAFEAEAAAMAGLRLPNIVTFFGAGVDGEGCGFLITELMANGSMTSVLIDRTSHPHLDWSIRLGFARDIAAGMRFLHNRQPPMLHRDLKSENVLLDDRWVAKVSDFGTLRSLAQGQSLFLSTTLVSGVTSNLAVTATGGCGTPLWTAPEVTLAKNGVSRYGPSADVYSCGIVLFEIAARTRPWEEMGPELSLFQLRAKVAEGQRPTFVAEPADLPEGYRALMEACWHADPATRPTFVTVARLLQAMVAGQPQ